MKKVGIFLDHASARFINPENGSIEHQVHNPHSGHERIPGQSTDGTKTGHISSSNNEHNRHQREQKALHDYYKELAAAVKKYDSVYLFGPTTAREEFRNFLSSNGHGGPAELVSEKADYMTDNQLIAKVKQHFK